MTVKKIFKLSTITYYKTGGLVDHFYQPENENELKAALEEIKKSGKPFFLMGAGSNSLVSDEPFHGSVLHFGRMNSLHLKDGNTLVAGAGVSNFSLSEFALAHKLGDASWMYGLPGDLGATVRMNARCYGGEINQIVTAVKSFTLEGEKKIYQNSPGDKTIFRAYKDTIFMDNTEVIYEVEITLSPAKQSELKEKMIFCYEDRKKKDQYLWPSCGCVFKNDYRKEVSVPSGLLIDHCGLKGFQMGGAQVSEKHANFIQNRGASSREILELTLHIRETVWKNLGVWMQYEMETLGHFPKDLKERLQERREENFNHEELTKLREKFRSR